MTWCGGITLFPSSVFVNKTAKDKTADLFQDSQSNITERPHLERINSYKGCRLPVFLVSSFLKPMPQRGADRPLLKSYYNQSGLDATPGWHTEHLPLKMNSALAKQALGINPVHTCCIHSLSRGYQPARSTYLDSLWKPHHSCSQVTLLSIFYKGLYKLHQIVTGKSTVNVHKVRGRRLLLIVCPFLLSSMYNLCGTNIINR